MNILKPLNIPKSGEIFTTLLEHKNIKIVRIVSSEDIDHNEYIQDEDEWVLVVKGGATMIVEEKKITLKEGETLFIPTKTKHTITSTQKGTVWLAVHIF